MSKYERKIRAEGHLIDSDLLSAGMDLIIREQGRFRILRLEVGQTNDDQSRVDMIVEADAAVTLEAIMVQLNDLGFSAAETIGARFEPAPADGVVPDDFYSTTNHHTEVFVDPEWISVQDQRMDACIVRTLGDGPPSFRCTKIRDVPRGTEVLVGLDGVRVLPGFTPRDRVEFSFMDNEVSSERQVRLAVNHVADLVRATQATGRHVVWVPGPVVIHTGAAEDFAALVAGGFVDSVLSGNALAVHDVENALFETSLGVSTKDGRVVHLGHRHHMRAINAIRSAGSLRAAVEQGVLTKGIFHALVTKNVPFVLAGSIRDDGPLPDTEMNLLSAQDAYAEQLKGAGLVIVLASMLHGIGVGNMLPASVTLVCVDIHSAVVTKLCDRGSAQTHGVITDVGLFLHLLRQALDGND